VKQQLAKKLKGFMETSFNIVLSFGSPQAAATNMLIDKGQTVGEDKLEQVKSGQILTDEEANKYAKSLTKGMLALGVDYVSASINVKGKPSRPQAPVATFTEGVVRGTIDDATVRASPQLIIPGVRPSYSNDVTPSNYPVYNELPGLFAMLETPKVKMNDWKTWERVGVGGNGVPVEFWYRNHMFLQVEDIAYVLNPALDFDMEKTKLYFMLELKYEQNFSWNSLHLPNSDMDLGNLHLEHQFPKDDYGNHSRTMVFQSGIYPIENARNLFFYDGLTD
jgi:hypothetical protein